jgi:hypothetical protein
MRGSMTPTSRTDARICLILLRRLDDRLQLFRRQQIAQRNHDTAGIEADSHLFSHCQTRSLAGRRSDR